MLWQAFDLSLAARVRAATRCLTLFMSASSSSAAPTTAPPGALPPLPPPPPPPERPARAFAWEVGQRLIWHVLPWCTPSFKGPWQV